MKVRMLPEAETEAQEAASWYENQLRGLGFDFMDALAIALEAIEKYPRRHAKVPGRFGSREVRRVLLQRFPYKVVYEVRPRESVVLAVAHEGRRPAYWRRRNGPSKRK
jgi:hypothetical protein